MTNQALQIAFQGGGARLAAIIAAVEVIDDYRERDVLNPVMVSGTSAGAVGAVLTALSNGAGKKAADFLRSLPEADIIKALPALSSAGYLKMFGYLGKSLFGFPLANDKFLRTLLVDCLGHCGVTNETPLGDLPVKTKIIAADIRHAEKVVFEGSDKVIDSLINSMSLPGVYSMPKARGRDNSIVDGGLFSNLPVDELDHQSGDDEFVPKIAVSFKEFDYGTYAEGTIKYAGQILGAVVDEKVKAAIKKIEKENVCLVKTPLSLFDSDKIKMHLSGDDHEEAKQSVTDFFETWLPEQAKLRLELARSSGFSDARRLNDMTATLNELADAQKDILSTVHLDYIVMRVSALSLNVNGGEISVSDDRDDAVEIEVQIPQGTRAVSCMRFDLITPIDNRAQVEDIHWKVKSGDGTPLVTYKFPVLNDDGTISRYILIFDPPLGSEQCKPGPYKIYYTQSVKGMCRDLGEKNWDLYAQSCGTFGGADRIEVCYKVPSAIHLEASAIMDRKRFIDLTRIGEEKVSHDLNFVPGELLQPNPDVQGGFRSFRWSCGPIKRNDIVAVRFWRDD